MSPFSAVLCLGLALPVFAQVPMPVINTPVDTAHADTSKASRAGDTVSAGVRIYEYIAYPTLQIITWPVETILVPVVQVLIYPTREPVRYVLNENVVDRMIGLISFGEREQIKVYPTLSLASGTSSRPRSATAPPQPCSSSSARSIRPWWTGWSSSKAETAHRSCRGSAARCARVWRRCSAAS